jgi:flagellar hook-basal body complex protein FliE
MSPIGSITSAFPALPVNPTEQVTQSSPTTAPGKAGFGSMLEGLVNTVNSKEAASDALTNDVMLGNTGALHQSVIAMQEASTALSLMVQVRNKLVESYQELMRMQV